MGNPVRIKETGGGTFLGLQVDPYKQKLPPSKPVKDENREEYNLLKDSLMTVLQSIPTDF